MYVGEKITVAPGYQVWLNLPDPDINVMEVLLVSGGRAVDAIYASGHEEICGAIEDFREQCSV
jgi:hypothetical protein